MSHAASARNAVGQRAEVALANPRPVSDAFADDVIEELIARTEKGETLTGVCAEPRMPSRQAVYDWLESKPDFALRFRAARARGVHALAEQCLEIADEDAEDAIAVANKRVRIDTRLRLAGKWLPSVYGERQVIAGDPDAPIQHEHRQVLDISALDFDQREALRTLLANANVIEGEATEVG